MYRTLAHALLIFGCSLSGGNLMAADTGCGSGSADERLACLTRQQCPDATTDKELAACYRQISLRLLSPAHEPRAMAAAPAAEAATPPPAQQLPATTVAANSKPMPAPVPATNVAAKATTPAPTAAAAAQASPEENFGLPHPPVRETPREAEEISAVIVRLKKQPRGNYLIALDNGQLWQENEPSRSLLRKGQQVRIVKRQLNAYQMFPDKSRATGVNRIYCADSEPDPRCALLDS